MKILFAAMLIPSGAAAQQGFTCSYGDRGACLGYGDTVCSSSGKCVSENAACFDSYQCNYEGFTCKSNVHDALAAAQAGKLDVLSLRAGYCVDTALRWYGARISDLLAAFR